MLFCFAFLPLPIAEERTTNLQDNHLGEYSVTICSVFVVMGD